MSTSSSSSLVSCSLLILVFLPLASQLVVSSFTHDSPPPVAAATARFQLEVFVDEMQPTTCASLETADCLLAAAQPPPPPLRAFSCVRRRGRRKISASGGFFDVAWAAGLVVKPSACPYILDSSGAPSRISRTSRISRNAR